MKQKILDLKVEIYKYTIIIKYSNTLLLEMDRTSRQKNSKIQKSWMTTNPFNLTDIYGTLNPTMAEFTLFSSVHRPFIKRDHTLCHMS